MIAIESIRVAYGDHLVLDELSLTIPVQKVHGLVGMNGAGKTTLLNAMAGYVKPISGSILMQGQPLLRRDLAFLETENYFYSHITGREYLGLFTAPSGSPGIDEWNRMFRLPLDQVIDGYSSGMKKKLALAGVLRQDKPLVILDEPFNGLDLESSRLLGMIITKLKERGKTILITSHILESLTGLCDYIHLIGNGRIRFTREKGNFANLEQEIFKDTDPGYAAMVSNII
jgi:ABC-2 type transport system ATP-binding protein